MQDVALGGYILKVSTNDAECFYKFNSKLQIKANTVTTVSCTLFKLIDSN